MTEDKNMEQQTLEVAERLFLEQGFASTTTYQIAQKAGCNKVLLHYYRTKNKLQYFTINLFKEIDKELQEEILKENVQTNVLEKEHSKEAEKSLSTAIIEMERLSVWDFKNRIEGKRRLIG